MATDRAVELPRLPAGRFARASKRALGAGLLDLG